MKNISIRTKILFAGIALPAVLVATLFAFYYVSARESALEGFIAKARAICLTAESTREEMEQKWSMGLFDHEMLRQWSEAGAQDKVLAAVPVVSAWRSAMMKSGEGEYTFRTPKFQPRNPANAPDEVEARALKALAAGAPEHVEIDREMNAVRFFRPVVLSETCMNCHGEPALSAQLWGNDAGLDPTGARMEGWKVGEVHGAFEVVQSLEAADAEVAYAMITGGGAVVLGLAAYAIFFTVFMTRAFVRPLNRTVQMLSGLERGELDRRLDMRRADEIGTMAQALDAFAENLKSEVLTAFQRLASGDFTFQAKGLIRDPLAEANESLNRLMSEIRGAGELFHRRADEVSDSSQTLSQGATESAASLEQISASLHELTSQTRGNAENALQARQLTQNVQSAAEEGSRRMKEMVDAMAEINLSGQSISKIIKVIDEIAFQTNLLALNAAVEAARAGAHGKGFAVVAEEVRNLAARSAKAAQETETLIAGALAKAGNGAGIAERTAGALEEIVTGIGLITDLAAEIATASNEQAEGISQISIGVSQIDQVTQQNTATAEQCAAASMELSSQAGRLLQMLSRFRLTLETGESGGQGDSGRRAEMLIALDGDEFNRS